MCARPLFLAAALAAAPLALVYGDQPPANGKPLAEIVETLEKQGYGPFSEISFDDGYWEIEVYKQNEPYELAVDPSTGKIAAEHRDDAEPRPPQDALPLSRVLQSLAKAGYQDIHEVSFERLHWEVEVRRTDGKHEIQVDLKTANILRDRLDD
jgi:uncharacterized membrane protein YkoI